MVACLTAIVLRRGVGVETATDATHVVIGNPPIQMTPSVAPAAITTVVVAVLVLDRDPPWMTGITGLVAKSDGMMMNVLGTEALVVTATMAASEHQVPSV